MQKRTSLVAWFTILLLCVAGVGCLWAASNDRDAGTHSRVLIVDVSGNVGGTAEKNGDYVVTGIYEANFGPTSFSLADANCCASLGTWPDNLVRIGVTLYDANMPQLQVTISGAATAGSPVLQGVGIWSMPVTATVARTMQFYSSVPQKGAVYKMQPRN
jgi:hypothetical protein